MFPNKQPHDNVRQTDDLCRLFSETLHALAADALTVRQLTSMSKQSGVTGDENLHPNNDNNLHDSLNELRKLDMAVAAIENKVGALREIVTEEKMALDQFEKLQQETNKQQRVLEHMMTVVGAASSRLSNKNPRGDRRRDSVDPRKAQQLQEATGTTTSSSSSTNDENHDIVLPRITESQLQSISRNTRGRISILALNEALEEIETVCRNKMAQLPRKPTSTTTSSSSLTAPQSLERRYEYLKQRNHNSTTQVEVDAHSGQYWVSEQELRESCAFFRLGESTARATLVVLCTLKRLKQLPGKNMEVTYICLCETESNTRT
jgi:hypothetical protein